MKIATEHETWLAVQNRNVVGQKMWLLDFTESAPKSAEKRPYDGCRGLVWFLATVDYASKSGTGIFVKHTHGEEWYPGGNARLAV